MNEEKKVTRYLVHFLLIISVAVYAVCGAFIMQSLENSSISYKAEQSEISKRSVQTGERENARQSVRTSSNNNNHNTDNGIHKTGEFEECILQMLYEIVNSSGCTNLDDDPVALEPINRCFSIEISDDGQPTDEDEDEKWTFLNALIFAYTVITTIGYGHVAPVTPGGRVFCVCYALIGVPFTLLTVADLGLFISKTMKTMTVYCLKKLVLFKKFLKHTPPNSSRKPTVADGANGEIATIENKLKNVFDIESCSIRDEQASEIVESSERNNWDTLIFGVTFFAYLMIGSYIFSLYEPDMDFIKATYFNFVTLTTIGLGDLVPKSDKYLGITMVYITIGLALTTIAMELASDLLKRIHYFGRKIENVSHMHVWFGGKRMTVKNLVKHLGDRLNVPLDELNNLNLDHFVNSAIKVETGEIKTLRKPENEVAMRKKKKHPLRYSDLRRSEESESLQYIDIRTRNGGEPPLAEETARTIHSSNLPVLDELSMNYEYLDAFLLQMPPANSTGRAEQSERSAMSKIWIFWRNLKESTMCWKGMHPSAVPSLIDSSEDIS